MAARLSVRFSVEGRREIGAAAGALSMSSARFVRLAALERAAGRLAVMDPGERKLLAGLLVELKRQGSNLNQYALAANTIALGLKRDMGLPGSAQAAAAFADVQTAVDRLHDVLFPLEARIRAGRPGRRSV